MSKEIILDIETGGLNPKENHALCSITIHLDKFFEVWFIKPRKEWVYREDAMSINKITFDLLDKEGEELEYVLKELAERIEENDLIIGHNLKEFDIPFLEHMYELCKLESPFKDVELFDTKQVINEKIKIKEVDLDNSHLINVHQYYYPGNKEFRDNAHLDGGVYDVAMTKDIYEKLVEIKE